MIGEFTAFYKSRKGAAIVEASIVYPIIILVSMALILCLIWTYILLAANSHMHVEGLQAAGVKSTCFSLLNSSEIAPADDPGEKEFQKTIFIEERGVGIKKIYAGKSTFLRKRGFFGQGFDIYDEIDINLLNEVDTIRCLENLSLAGEVQPRF